jgi:MFS family permease
MDHLNRIYNAALSAGVAFGIIISGLITIQYPWRTIYWVGCALVGGLFIVILFFFPETAFVRAGNPLVEATHGLEKEAGATTVESLPEIPPKENYWQHLRPWTGKTYTEESFWRMFIRPFLLILVPTVFWATIVMSVTIGFLVAVVSNVASAFSTTYGFAAWQSGLCFIAGIVGCLLGTFAGGPFSDWVADYFTQRNNGIREPEMRLPAIIPSVVAAPVALLLYGLGIANQWHWIVPTFGLGLRKNCLFQTDITGHIQFLKRFSY